MIREILRIERSTSDDLKWQQPVFDAANDLGFKRSGEGTISVNSRLWIPEDQYRILLEIPLHFLVVDGLFPASSRYLRLIEHKIDFPITTLDELVQANKSLDALFIHARETLLPDTSWSRKKNEEFLEPLVEMSQISHERAMGARDPHSPELRAFENGRRSAG